MAEIVQCAFDVVCCIISLSVLGWIGLMNTAAWSGQRTEVQTWSDGTAVASWKVRQCKVHGVGLSHRGGCWEKSPGKTVWTNPAPGHFSECPGLRWCADEGGTCDGCGGGDVLFAAAAFQGNLPVGNKSAVLRQVEGAIPCTTSSFGSDPMPFHKKFCFCTPAGVAELVREKGPLEPPGTNCTQLANDAFDEEARGIRQRSRRLELDDAVGRGRDVAGASAAPPAEKSPAQGATSGTASSAAAVAAAQQKWQLPDGHCLHEITRQLDFDYRVYLPWALVEVREEGSSRLRCAYNYGAEVASREEWSQAHSLYEAWKAKESGEAVCYVREHGVCGLSGCAVALERPEDMGSQDIAFRQFENGVLYALAFLAPCLVCCLIICVLERQGAAASESSGEEESSMMD